MGRVLRRSEATVGRRPERGAPALALFFFLTVSFLSLVLFLPVRIRVEPGDVPFRSGTWVDGTSCRVQAVSFAGVGYDMGDGYLYQSQDKERKERKRVSVWWKDLSDTVILTGEVPGSYEVVYGRPVYVGQVLFLPDVSVRAVYGDGYSEELSHLELPKDAVPMAKRIRVPIRTPAGIVDWSTDTVVPERMEASYGAEASVGDEFSVEEVSVSLVYPDGTSFGISDFEVKNAPLYLSEETTLTVTSPYGDTELTIVPKDTGAVQASYEGTVYVGDRLEEGRLSLSFEGNPVADFTYEDPGVIHGETKLFLDSAYGTGILVIRPVGVESVAGTYETDAGFAEGDVPKLVSLVLTYGDGTTRDVAEFTQLSPKRKLGAGRSKVWFSYGGIRMWVPVYAVGSGTRELRDDSFRSGTAYPLSDAALSQLAVLCQRFCGNDLSACGWEASLMANRYDVYGEGRPFLDYVLDSGYWGDNAREYVSDDTYRADAGVRDLLYDVLVNGYRQFPSYVTERGAVAGKRGSYEKDRTDVTSADLLPYRFYGFPDGTSNVAYGYRRDIYQQVTGDVLPDGIPEVITTETDGGNIRIEDD